jgi:hypothetical protein
MKRKLVSFFGFAVLFVAAMWTTTGCDNGGGGGGGAPSPSTLTITGLGSWNGRYVLAIREINDDASIMGFAPGSNGNYSAINMPAITNGSATLEIWRVDFSAHPPALSPYTDYGTVTFDVEFYNSQASNASTVGTGKVTATFSNGKATGTFTR